MTVFVWTPTIPDPNTMSKLGFETSWAIPHPHCSLCGDAFKAGEKVWHWFSPHGGILLHADCVSKHGSGFLKDIAECMR